MLIVAMLEGNGDNDIADDDTGSNDDDGDDFDDDIDDCQTKKMLIKQKSFVPLFPLRATKYEY